MSNHWKTKVYSLNRSALFTVIGIICLFGMAIVITLLAPHHVDPTWTQPTSPYQVQIYEFQDPNLYLSSAYTEGRTLQYVDHLRSGRSLLAFVESEAVRIIAPPELENYITRGEDSPLQLTSRLLLLRPIDEAEERADYSPSAAVEKIRAEPQEGAVRVDYSFYELYDPGKQEAFALAFQDGIFANWVDTEFTIHDGEETVPFDTQFGVIYTKNPTEFRVMPHRFGGETGWRYHPRGEAVASLDQLRSPSLGFRSRKELIEFGEHIYAIEGCWYCHTDQTRTLVQDLVLNGAAEYPAPPSSPNEFIYQRITFPGTRRIGPDMSRVAIKRPSRDWHMSHFWAPRQESPGSIMPSFQHFFDTDPRGTIPIPGVGIPHYRFEALYQYLMTKGSRITPPNEAWWEGRDPIQTLEIIQGEKQLP